MPWSWSVGRVAGIEIRVHATFPLLLVWIAFVYYVHDRTLATALRGVLFAGAIFGTVVLHELGHALVAARFGFRTRDITLLPIGGVARLERAPERPLEELAVAAAGPAVNLAIAAIAFLALRAAGAPLFPLDPTLTSTSFGAQFLWTNVALAAFNLLPAFPMDGGRVLRAVLAAGLGRVRATAIAAAAGRVMAVLFGMVGTLGNPVLVLIALFVWVAAGEEARAVEIETALAPIPVARAMVADVRTLEPDAPLVRAAAVVLRRFQEDFPVVDQNGIVIGLLGRGDLLRALAQGRAEATVGDVMRRDVPTIEPDDTLGEALSRLRTSGSRALPVVRGGQLLGLITADQIEDVLLFRASARGGAAMAGGRRT